MENLILHLDMAGRPMEWIHWEYATLLYAREQVAWEMGEHSFRIHGGVNRMTGDRSYLDVNSIVATHGVSQTSDYFHDVPSLTNTRLFRRDENMCMYCGEQYVAVTLTRDHVIPISRGGKDVWSNVVTACRSCNARKDNMLPKEAEQYGISLLGVPYAPNHAEGLILSNRKILADQMAFLKAQCPKERRD